MVSGLMQFSLIMDLYRNTHTIAWHNPGSMSILSESLESVPTPHCHFRKKLRKMPSNTHRFWKAPSFWAKHRCIYQESWISCCMYCSLRLSFNFHLNFSPVQVSDTPSSMTKCVWGRLGKKKVCTPLKYISFDSTWYCTPHCLKRHLVILAAS